MTVEPARPVNHNSYQKLTVRAVCWNSELNLRPLVCRTSLGAVQQAAVGSTSQRCRNRPTDLWFRFRYRYQEEKSSNINISADIHTIFFTFTVEVTGSREEEQAAFRGRGNITFILLISSLVKFVHLVSNIRNQPKQNRKNNLKLKSVNLTKEQTNQLMLDKEITHMLFCRGRKRVLCCYCV